MEIVFNVIDFFDLFFNGFLLFSAFESLKTLTIDYFQTDFYAFVAHITRKSFECF